LWFCALGGGVPKNTVARLKVKIFALAKFSPGYATVCHLTVEGKAQKTKINRIGVCHRTKNAPIHFTVVYTQSMNYLPDTSVDDF